MTDAEFREAYGRHKDMLYRFAIRMTGSSIAAEDLVHDCFLMLWRKAVTYDPERGTLRSFLIGVTRNLALKHLHKRRAFDELAEEGAVCEPFRPEGIGRVEMVEQAVEALPPLQREALILAEYEEMTLEEIAQATGAELAAVKSRLHRARENLKRMLAPLLEGKGVEVKGKVYGTRK
jgi:RNA polymerase sigma-70 factor (ECF subfamily)